MIIFRKIWIDKINLHVGTLTLLSMLLIPNRAPQGLWWQFSGPHGHWPHRWDELGWLRGRLRAWSQGSSAPAPWGALDYPSHLQVLCGPVVQGDHCTSLVWWIVTQPGSGKGARGNKSLLLYLEGLLLTQYHAVLSLSAGKTGHFIAKETEA